MNVVVNAMITIMEKRVGEIMRRSSPTLRMTSSTSPTFACAVKRRWSTAGKGPPGNWFAPPGSNRSSCGGKVAAEASGVEGRFRRLGEFVGRNESVR